MQRFRPYSRRGFLSAALRCHGHYGQDAQTWVDMWAKPTARPGRKRSGCTATRPRPTRRGTGLPTGGSAAVRMVTPSRTPRSHAFAWVRSAGLTPCEAKGTLRPPGLPGHRCGAASERCGENPSQKSLPRRISEHGYSLGIFRSTLKFGRVCHGP